MMNRQSVIAGAGILLGFAFLAAVVGIRSHSDVSESHDSRPNFLIVVSDDQSWPHTSYAGFPQIRTPGIDEIARRGLRFRNGYASAPTCTASRSALLSGEHFWQTGTGANLWGRYPEDLPDFQTILAEHGYAVGYTGKGWGPGKPQHPGINPAGPGYNRVKNPGPPGISDNDYSANFVEFLSHREKGQPFSFLFTPWEPHRPYGNSQAGGINPDDVPVPGFLPDVPELRADVARYLREIEWFDGHLAKMLDELRRRQLLNNTIVLVTSDNGMPFPRAKANNYEYGVHVPFVAMWLARGVSGPPRNEFVNLADIAPTVLDAAGVDIPRAMTGKSFLPILSGQADVSGDWTYTVTGMERHMPCRPDMAGYPMRAIHTEQFTFILNLAADRWPAGDPPDYCDIDGTSATRDFLLGHQREFPRYMALATAKRPRAELYLRESDPENLKNLIDDPRYRDIAAELQQKLVAFLKQTGDPRFTGHPDAFADIPYNGALPAAVHK